MRIRYPQPKKYRIPNWNINDEKGLGVHVWATFVGEDSPRELTTWMTQARTRNSTLWADDPKQQIAYLALKKWARLYCPDVILSVYTRDELEASAIARF
ncbi:recombinase RecT [Pseudomonas sp. 39167]|uniref:recombinase RecT n=1 Tax=Pseudomonas sp. 39167 TaxID=2967215 RepID=UPI003FD25154